MVKGSIGGPGGVKGLGGELPGHVHYGIEGPPGGHYIPKVSQTGEEAAVITFTASKPGMPAVAPTQIELPVGPAGYTPQRGVDYWTPADKNEVVNSVLGALPLWTPGSY